jgi:hypothetical protein
LGIAAEINYPVGVIGADMETLDAYGRVTNSATVAVGCGPPMRPPRPITDILAELPLAIRDALQRMRLSADRAHTWAYLAEARHEVVPCAAELAGANGDDDLTETVDLL